MCLQGTDDRVHCRAASCGFLLWPIWNRPGRRVRVQWKLCRECHRRGAHSLPSPQAAGLAAFAKPFASASAAQCAVQSGTSVKQHDFLSYQALDCICCPTPRSTMMHAHCTAHLSSVLSDFLSAGMPAHVQAGIFIQMQVWLIHACVGYCTRSHSRHSGFRDHSLRKGSGCNSPLAGQ